jgi:hypothetical protein
MLRSSAFFKNLDIWTASEAAYIRFSLLHKLQVKSHVYDTSKSGYDAAKGERG